ncbi:MAG: cyanophycinase, partial [Nannocystaceae bacterium]|nr:cyanophycinase [Nannocystaceae bacterium]
SAASDVYKRQVSFPLVGTVLAHGGGPLRANIIKRFCQICGPHGKLVLIPTAAEGADNPATLEKLPKRWLDRVGRVDVLHTLDPERANQADFIAPLKDADCVWLGGGAQGRLRDAYVDTEVQEALRGVLLRGGIVGGYSAGTAILPDVIIRRGNPDPIEDIGFGLLPGVIIDQHFLAKKREPRLRTMLARYPARVGYGIDEDTALLVHGSTYEVIGSSVVRRCVHAAGCESLEPGAKGSFP